MPPDPRPTPADRIVWFVAFASAMWLAFFVARFASRVPYLDEYSSIHFVLTPLGSDPAAYWHQHNEHRIPLPRFVYVQAVRLSGLDFRAPMYVISLLMLAGSAGLFAAVRRVRGRTSIADAFLPLAVLSVGQYENLTWGFQVQFILSITMFLGIVALAAHREFSHSTGRVALAGVFSLAQPLCGANGVAFAPALGVMLVVLGVRAGRTRAGILGVVIGLGTLALVPVYFHGLKPAEHHAAAKSVADILVSFVNLIGLGLGPVTHRIHALGYTGVTAAGGMMAVVVFVTAVMLIRATFDPERRSQALALGALLGAGLSLAAGLAYGRAGVGSVLSANRYVTLALPIPVVVYFAWVTCGRGVLARAVPAVLCAAAVAGAYTNTTFGIQHAKYHASHLKPLAADVAAGVPLSFLADKYRYVFPPSPAVRYHGFAMLRDKGVKPFDRIAPDPPLRAERVPLVVRRVANLDGSPGDLRAVGDGGHVVFALPRKQRVYGFRVVYEAHYENRNLPLNVLSWDPTGVYPPAAGRALFNFLGHTDEPTTANAFVDAETDHLRVDTFGRGSRLKVLELHVLTRADSVE